MSKVTPQIQNGDSGTLARTTWNTALKDVAFTDFESGVVIDDDTMATASDTTLATSESIKAYVDSQQSLIPTITTSAAGNYTVLTSDYLIRKTGITAGGDTVTLPSGATTGQIFVIKDSSGGALTDNITIDTAGAETIDGQASVVLNTNYASLKFYFDSTNYEII